MGGREGGRQARGPCRAFAHLVPLLTTLVESSGLPDLVSETIPCTHCNLAEERPACQEHCAGYLTFLTDAAQTPGFSESLPNLAETHCPLHSLCIEIPQ